MAPKNNERFAGIVTAAFSALGVTQAEFKALGGPSDTTLRKIMDGQPVGISIRTLNSLDRAFKWAPGSAAQTLAGGDPVPLSEDADLFLQKIRHPQYARGVHSGLDKGDRDLISILEAVIETGNLPDNAQGQLERLRDDAVIEVFPKRYETLNRDRKLRVARFGNEQWIQQLQEGGQRGLETGEATDAPDEASEDKEDRRVIRPAHWDDAPPPPPIELADAASVGHKESDESDDASE